MRLVAAYPTAPRMRTTQSSAFGRAVFLARVQPTRDEGTSFEVDISPGSALTGQV